MPRFHSLILTITALALLVMPGHAHAAQPTSLPASWSLTRFITRVHNQGNSNSCVAQTLSAIMEIENAEYAASHPRYARHHRYTKRWTAFSAGYIFNQLDYGSKYSWLTWQAAFGIATSQGIAPLDTFDLAPSVNWWTQPERRAHHYAQFHRFSWWKYIGTGDRTGIESEIRRGHPLALAIPVYTSFYQHWDGIWPVFAWFSGYYLYNHALVIVGYGPAGVTILNSWGTGWGYHGLATITWSALRFYGQSVIVAYPRLPR